MSSTSSSLYRSNISKRRRSPESIIIPSIHGDLQDDEDDEQLDTQSQWNDTPVVARTFKSQWNLTLKYLSICLQIDISYKLLIHV